jgi:hypothetical protein
MSVQPQRIQLKRTKGWRMPANTVKVDRTTRWGNYHAARAGVNGLEAVEALQTGWQTKHLKSGKARQS